jgi:hypothetical protein
VNDINQVYRATCQSKYQVSKKMPLLKELKNSRGQEVENAAMPASARDRRFFLNS